MASFVILAIFRNGFDTECIPKYNINEGGYYMIIKNGNVLLFKDNDVVIEKTDVKIKDGKMVIDVVGANGKDKKQHQFDVKF